MDIKKFIEKFGGKKVDSISEPEDFKDQVVKENRIGGYIDFDSIYNIDEKTSKSIKRLQSMVRDSATELLGRAIHVDELEKIMDCVDKAVLYSEITGFDNAQYVHTIITGVYNPNNDVLIVKSIPMENKEDVYKVTLMCGNKSIIISMDEIPVSHKYHIAFDIYKGCSKPYNGRSYSEMAIEDTGIMLNAINNARTGQLCTRDIFQVANMIFVPLDLINVGIYLNGKRRVLPYIIGYLNNQKSGENKGFAIKATPRSVVPTFLERNYELSLYNNEGLFMELIKKYKSNSIESLLMQSMRTYAEARLYFMNTAAIKNTVQQYMDYEFSDDSKFYNSSRYINLA
jgi:hypothetical protein